MSGNTVVSTARFVAEEVGVEKTVAALVSMSNAARKAAVENAGFAKQMAATERELARQKTAIASATQGAAPRTNAKVFEQSSRQLQQMARQVNAVRASVDPAFRDMQKFESALTKVTKAAQAEVITWQQHGEIVGQLRMKYGQAGTAAQAANQNIKLTGQQVQGLGYQINDVATMLAMGASPFQVMASQAGQVVQVLGDGPQGMKGSLAAIGSSIAGFARAIPVAGYAVAGLAAGVGALWYMTKGPEARSAEESLRTFKDAVDRLKGGWDDAADAAQRHYDAAKRSGDSAVAALLDTNRSAKDLRNDLQATIRDLNDSDSLSDKIIRPFSGAVSDSRREIMSLYADLRGGETDVKSFEAAMLRIRLDPKAPNDMRIFADEIRSALDPALELERQLQSLNLAAAQLAAPKGTMGRYDLPDEVSKDRFGPTIGSNNRFGDGEGLATIRQGLQDQREELTKVNPEIERYNDAVAGMRSSLAASVDGLQLQVDTFGQSEGAIAAATFRTNALRDAQEAATEAGRSSIDPELAAFIETQAGRYGALTDQIKAQTDAQRESTKAAEDARRQQERVAQLGEDIAFERSIIGMSDAEQQIRETLRSVDVDYESFEGQRLAAGLRYNDALTETQDRIREMGEIGEDVFDSLIDAIGKGEDVLGSFASAFAGLGKQLASDGFQKLFGGLFGGGAANGNKASIGSLLTGAAASVPSSSFSSAPKPSSAAQAISDKLADGVTKSVSSNLLSSLLGAGKSSSHISGLNTNFANALTNMLDAAPEAVRSAVTINSGFRSVARQAELFDAALKKYGSVAAARKWVAPPGNSQHNKGNAADLGYAGGAAKSWIHENAGKYGLAFPLGNEDWHIELASARGGNTKAIEKGVSQGVQQGLRATANQNSGGDAWAGMRETSGSTQQMTGGQRAFAGLAGGIGIFGQGYESGSPISGGLNGAMGGFELGSALGIGGPAGMALGAAAGCLGGKLGRKRRAA